jgi:hypothetical protein
MLVPVTRGFRSLKALATALASAKLCASPTHAAILFKLFLISTENEGFLATGDFSWRRIGKTWHFGHKFHGEEWFAIR